MRRLDRGAPLRTAMRAAGLDIPRLAARTKEVDPEGKGLSVAYIGFLVGEGRSAREDCSDRAARLLSRAVDRPLDNLFDTGSSMPEESTSTRVPQINRSLPERLMDQPELARFLKKSRSWVDQQIQSDPDWPVHYAGRSRRFDPIEVLDYLDKKRAA